MILTSSRISRSFEWLGISSPFDPTFNLVTSPFFSPLILGALRLLIAVYTLATGITILAFESARYHQSRSFLCFITHLSYIGLVAYFWATGVQTIIFALRGQKAYPLQSWPRILQLLHMLLYSTISTFPIMVTVIFWALLANSTTFSTRYAVWYNTSVHIINTVLVLFELFLTNGRPIPWSHILPLSLFYGCYLAVAYITYATQGFYVYDFLDPSTEHGFLALYICGNAIGCFLTFLIVRIICIFRGHFVTRLGFRCEQLEKGPSSQTKHLEEISEVEVDIENADVKEPTTMGKAE